MEIKGIPVILYDKVETGKDGFNNPVYTETPTEIQNVIVYPTTDAEILSSTDLNGKKAVYTICIPKEDRHEWRDRRVHFFGEDFHTIGFGKQYIEENLPLDWNKQFMVERYE